jgi:AcrR family transcriptional regulator/DNA-binding MarR family transcriptional regulator
MLAAIVEVAAEHGRANMSVAQVVQRAGVSRRTFYEIFVDLEDCFMAAFEHAVRKAGERVLASYRSQDRWQERLRAGLLALLVFFDEDPVTGRLLIVEAAAAGTRALHRRQILLSQLIAVVDEGRAQGGRRPPPPSLAAEGVVGAVVSILHRRMVEDDGQPLAGLTNELMSMIVLAYLGPAAARRELSRPLGSAVVARRGASQDPLKALRMRLTYRTVRVLRAVAARPASSNRMLGDAAGITDQGQVSKLLGRLERLGLIENAHNRPSPGKPNAWTLTALGEEVHGALAGSLGSL